MSECDREALTARSSWRTKVCGAIKNGLNHPGFHSRRRQGICIFSKTLRLAPGPTQLSVECVLGVLFPSVKRPWREINLAEAATKVTNDWFRNCAFPTCVHGVGGDKLSFQYRTNFTAQLCEGDIFYETYCYASRKILRFMRGSRECIKREARKSANLKLPKLIRTFIWQ